MIAMTLAEIAAATGGQLADATGAEVVTGPATVDSRAVEPGGLFVAVPGEHVDGHDFAGRAIAAGAVAVLAARPTGVPSVIINGDDPAGEVVAALGRLARTVLASAPAVHVTAVTGSSGKTSTKDLLGQVLAAAGPTVATQGSYNNDLGLPLTVLGITADTRHLVLEMGSRAIGDIARLCRIAPPDAAIVLNVGLAHVGEFGSVENTAVAKGELVEAVRPGGLAVLNADDPRVLAMASRTGARVVTFGVETTSPVDIRAERVELDGLGRARFSLVTAHGSADVSLQLVGAHHVPNALAAAGAALSAGLDLRAVAAGLAAARARSAGRMEVHDRSDGVTVVNDAFNANPDSMRAALHALVALGRARRTWAVLGEMLELGPEAESQHAAVGRLTMSLGVERLVAVGAGARSMQVAASAATADQERSVFVPDVDAALHLLRRQLRPGDVVLVKSSHSVGLGALGDALATDVDGPIAGRGDPDAAPAAVQREATP